MPPARVMGHAGAWAAAGEATAEQKYKVLQDAGATMVSHPEKFGGVMKTLLSNVGKDVGKIVCAPPFLSTCPNANVLGSKGPHQRISVGTYTL